MRHTGGDQFTVATIDYGHDGISLLLQSRNNTRRAPARAAVCNDGCRPIRYVFGDTLSHLIVGNMNRALDVTTQPFQRSPLLASLRKG